jgi:hypothetical protein
MYYAWFFIYRLFNLHAHSKTHDLVKEKPFDCEHCELKFLRYVLLSYLLCTSVNLPISRRHDLNRHLKTHILQKPHVCSDCGRSFARFEIIFQVSCFTNFWEKIIEIERTL